MADMDTLAHWQRRMTDLGMNPETDGINYRIIKHTNSLHEYKKWLDFPEQANAKTNDVDAEKIASVPDGLIRRYVTQHVSNEKVIEDAAVIAAIEKRVGRFFLFVQAAADITITAANPLIINSTGVVSVYNNVTIKDGGFIRMTVPVKFECQNLIKEQSGGDAAYDVFVVGADGVNDTSGNSPSQPGQTGSGSDAECDCCGGLVATDATNGAPGATGGNGGDAPGINTVGGVGPSVFFFVNNSLTGTLSFLNQGGTGGAGGHGGNGAQGGKGGNGGDGETCGAIHASGAAGGTGGKGGNGGNASNGKDGGPGGTLSISVPQSAVSSVLVTNGQAPGGTRGTRGLKGQGGPGGDAGDDGGSPGSPGSPGDSDGNDGSPGNPGGRGSTTVNGSPVG